MELSPTNSIKSKKEQLNQESEKILLPLQEVLMIRGKVIYHENAQAHNVIRLSRDVLLQYPQLREKDSSFSYTMILPRTREEVKQQLKNFRKKTKMFPIFLFLERE